MGACYVCAGAVGLLALSSATTLATAGGRVVVGHDANTLSTSLGGTAQQRAAVNIADWLLAGSPAPVENPSILLVQSSRFDPRHDIAQDVMQSLMNAGYTVTSTYDHNQTFEALSQYNAVFTSFDFEMNYAFQDANVLTTYVQQGGGVYVWAGMGPDTNIEVATLNPFLANVGLRFDPQLREGLGGGNGIYGHTVVSSHPIFDGITGSWLRSQNGGTAISTTGTVPSAQVIESVNGVGIYAVSEGVIPTPGAGVLAVMGLVTMVMRRRW